MADGEHPARLPEPGLPEPALPGPAGQVPLVDPDLLAGPEPE